MSKLRNVPSIKNHLSTECEHRTHNYVVFNSTTGLTICEICTSTHRATAGDIACVLREMQKAGFEQGRKHVRDALGIGE